MIGIIITTTDGRNCDVARKFVKTFFIKNGLDFGVSHRIRKQLLTLCSFHR